MRRDKKFICTFSSVLFIISLSACNNLGLLDKLENPSSTSSGGQKIPNLYLFATTNGFDGNIMGAAASTRNSADSECMATRATVVFPENGCNQVRAVISTTAIDSIANMPSAYGVPVNRSIHGPNNFVIASDWGILIAGTSGNTLVSGNYDATNNCSGGTYNLTGNGATGHSSTAGNTWLANSTMACNASSVKLLCVCY